MLHDFALVHGLAIPFRPSPGPHHFCRHPDAPARFIPATSSHIVAVAAPLPSLSSARPRCSILGVLLALAAVYAPTPRAEDISPQPSRLDAIVVTATRVDQRAFDLPVAIDSVDATRIQQNQLQINLSESLNRVPGLVV